MAAPVGWERSRLTTLDRAAVAVLLGLHGALAWMLRTAGVSTSNDDALYLILGRSLRQLTYRDIHLAGSPIHGQYPPGYPALLAITQAVFGDGLGPVHLVTILCSVVALFLAFDMTRRLAGVWPALALLSALSVNQNLIAFAGEIRSEAPYTLLCLAALWAYLVIRDHGQRLWLAGTLAVFAFLTRSIGIGLVAAFGLVLLLEHRWRAPVVFALVGGSAVTGWFAWTVAAPVRFASRSYVAVMTEGPQVSLTWLQRLEIMAARAIEVYGVRGPLAGLGVPSFPATWVDNLFWLVLLWCLCLAGMRKLWRTSRLPVYYLVASLGMLALYPHKMTRFFMPLAPVYLMVVMVGLTWAAGRWPRGALGLAGLLVGGLTVAGAGRAADSLAAQADCDQLRGPEWKSCLKPEAQAFFGAIEFAKDHLPRGSVVLTVKEAPFAYYSGLRVFHPEAVRGAHSASEYLRRLEAREIDYVLLSAFPGGNYAARALSPECRRMEVIYESAPRTWLLRTGADAAAAIRTGSCRAMEEAVQYSMEKHVPDPFRGPKSVESIP